jgi:hypothetical protein
VIAPLGEAADDGRFLRLTQERRRGRQCDVFRDESVAEPSQVRQGVVEVFARIDPLWGVT